MLESPPAASGAPFASHEESSELREYVAVLRARKWSIIAITALTVIAALFFSFRQTPIYESETQVLVNPIPPSGFQSVLAPAPNLDTERTVASSAEVAELAAARLEGSHDPRELLEGLSVEVATNSEVLVFRYAHPSPIEAQRRAQAFSQSYVEFRREKALESLISVQESIQEQIDDVSRQLRQVIQQLGATTDEVERANLQTRQSQLAAQLAVLEQQRSESASIAELRVADIIAQADLPSSPASPNHILNGALALLVGLALGVGLAFLRERLDDRLRGQGDLEARAGAPVLAIVPRVGTWRKSDETPLVVATEPKSAAAEAYRTLRTSLLFAAAERGLRVIMVTSPHPNEGKTATAANLAVVLAQAGRRVVAISGDLRKPRLHRFFRRSNISGLSRLLTGEEGFREVVQDVGIQNLRLVGSGPVPKNPAELLGSHAMAKALERFRDAADIVLIDAPPVLDVADTMTMAPFTDAVVLVADAERTSRGALSQARKQLEQVKAEVIGAVLNNLDPSKARAYPYYYRYYYRYGYTDVDREEERKPSRRRPPPEPEPLFPTVEVSPPEQPRAEERPAVQVRPAPPPAPAPVAPPPSPPVERRAERKPPPEPKPREATPGVPARRSPRPEGEDPLQRIWAPSGSRPPRATSRDESSSEPPPPAPPPDERVLDEAALLRELLGDFDETSAPRADEEPPEPRKPPEHGTATPRPAPTDRQ